MYRMLFIYFGRHIRLCVCGCVIVVPGALIQTRPLWLFYCVFRGCAGPDCFVTLTPVDTSHYWIPPAYSSTNEHLRYKFKRCRTVVFCYLAKCEFRFALCELMVAYLSSGNLFNTELCNILAVEIK